jgi:hypothetical protein
MNEAARAFSRHLVRLRLRAGAPGTAGSLAAARSPGCSHRYAGFGAMVFALLALLLAPAIWAAGVVARRPAERIRRSWWSTK